MSFFERFTGFLQPLKTPFKSLHALATTPKRKREEEQPSVPENSPPTVKQRTVANVGEEFTVQAVANQGAKNNILRQTAVSSGKQAGPLRGSFGNNSVYHRRFPAVVQRTAAYPINHQLDPGNLLPVGPVQQGLNGFSHYGVSVSLPGPAVQRALNLPGKQRKIRRLHGPQNPYQRDLQARESFRPTPVRCFL